MLKKSFIFSLYFCFIMINQALSFDGKAFEQGVPSELNEA